MARYLDPKADLTFKRIFGEHKDLVISFLNALLPLADDELVETVEYLTPEMIPDAPWRKYSVVDVRCADGRGRQFIVEMQILWSREFKQRVMFNASKAYVRQLKRGTDYELLQPVYSLNLVNEVFEPKMEEYYHYYRMVHDAHSDKVIEGLNLIFVELPKFKPQSLEHKKMMVLWLRFLTEVSDGTAEVSPELRDNSEVSKALSIVEEAAFTREELDGYEKFWDGISIERTLVGSAERRGLERGEEQGEARGMAKGMAKGLAMGIEQGRAEEKMHIARSLLGMGLPAAQVARATGLAIEQLAESINDNDNAPS